MSEPVGPAAGAQPSLAAKGDPIEKLKKATEQAKRQHKGKKLSDISATCPNVTVDLLLVTCFSLPDTEHTVNRWADTVHGVKNAVVTCGAVKTNTGKWGAPVRLTFPFDQLGTHTLTVTPAGPEISSAPAGVATAKGGGAGPDRMFRPFDVEIRIDEQGFEEGFVPKITLPHQPEGTPPYAVVFGAVEPDWLAIDWKPDWIRSRNCQPRDGVKVNCLVLHQTGGNVIGSAINTFAPNTGTAEGTSAHYLVDLDGHVVKLVHEDDAARHAGHSFWDGEIHVNSFSIGIEIVHSDVPPCDFPQAQMDAVARLVTEIRRELTTEVIVEGQPPRLKPAIPRQRVVGHCDVETSETSVSLGTDRELDPGLWFDWSCVESRCALTVDADAASSSTIYGLSKGERALTTGAKGPHIRELKQDLSKIGYSVSANDGLPHGDNFDVATQRALQRFKAHHGPRKIPKATWDREKGRLTFDDAMLIKQVLADDGE